MIKKSISISNAITITFVTSQSKYFECSVINLMLSLDFQVLLFLRLQKKSLKLSMATEQLR